MRETTRHTLEGCRAAIEQNVAELEAAGCDPERVEELAVLLGLIDAELRPPKPYTFDELPIGVGFRIAAKDDVSYVSYVKVSEMIATRVPDGHRIYPAGDIVCVPVSADKKI